MLRNVDLDQSIELPVYEHLLEKYQSALKLLTYQIYLKKRPMIIVFEGWNASGKGEAIRRVTENIDPRGFVVHAIAPVTENEARQHYLWRFWQLLPASGRIAIFDRSWYGRVLADRVDGLIDAETWQRAYREINHFERQLVDFGTIPFKFWMHIDKNEQLKRYELRSEAHFHHWRLGEPGCCDPEMWDRYEEAASEMLQRTNTIIAPWTVIEANCQQYAQIKVLKTIIDQLRQELDFDPLKAQKSAKIKKKHKKS